MEFARTLGRVEPLQQETGSQHLDSLEEILLTLMVNLSPVSRALSQARAEQRLAALQASHSRQAARSRARYSGGCASRLTLTVPVCFPSLIVPCGLDRRGLDLPWRLKGRFLI